MRAPLSGFGSHLPVRGIDLTRLLDTVLVCAVATILVIRTDLWLTNYPQIGGHGLHIAHLLWGGLGMLVAIVILLAFISPGARGLAAIVGGVGLGLFMDELGKFVTADNNYFFRPTAALIYIFFVAFFLVIRQLGRRRSFTEREYLVNAVELVKEAALREMDETEHRRALALLGQADQDDPLVPKLRAILDGVRRHPTRPPSWATLVARALRRRFFEVVDRPWFATAVVGFFTVWALASLAQILGLLFFAESGLSSQQIFRLGERITSNPLGKGDLDFLQWADFAASLVTTTLVVAGLYLVRGDRRAAGFAMFERALLVSLFFTQVFAFVYSEFFAVFGFLFDLLLFVAVRTMVSRELEREALGHGAAVEPAGKVVRALAASGG